MLTNSLDLLTPLIMINQPAKNNVKNSKINSEKMCINQKRDDSENVENERVTDYMQEIMHK